MNSLITRSLCPSSPTANSKKITFYSRVKNRLRFILITVLTVQSITPIYSQNYSFKDYLEDDKIRKHFNGYTSIEKADSIAFYLKQYKDKLHYHKYLYTAVVLNKAGSSKAMQYLDTAFMHGLSWPCLHIGLFKQLEETYAKASYEKNYLKAFDHSLQKILDSLETEAQHFRTQVYHFSGKKSQDSLMALQRKIDSSNFSFYKKLIRHKGWPTFKKVGGHTCAYSPASPNLVIIHLGAKERSYQMSLLHRVIELSKEQVENWGNITWLLSNFYYQFNDTYADFIFLKIKDNKLDETESLFSLYCMADYLIKIPTYKLAIRCKNKELYGSIKRALIDMNNLVTHPFADEELVKQIHATYIKKLDESSFVFEQNNTLPDNKVLFKFVIK